MRYSQLFTKTLKEEPKDEEALNAKLLRRAGFVYKNSSGVYSFLPLGWRVLQKISDIIRQEMNSIGGQEMLMSALHDKHYLKATGRWNIDVVYKVITEADKTPNFNISWTHEEIIAEIATKYVHSYKDLPFSVYQIQTKFRSEPRAKSGILRGREFLMKDMYSFHTCEENLMDYYEEVGKAYHKIFNRCGLKSIYTLAPGGEFTIQKTHEFQVISEAGEDTIYFCSKCQYAENKEVSQLKQGFNCPQCSNPIEQKKSIEVGNIFPLGTKYSQAFDLKFTDEKGNKKFVVMGSYGIGLTRTMGTVVEIHHDSKGIIWPKEISPFQVHLISLETTVKVKKAAEKLYRDLQKIGVEVLYDDRQDKSAGEKFSDADLIGIPLRIVVSEKTLKRNSFELKERNSEKTKLVKNVQQNLLKIF
jgi:prolyl-tRNA synthetase